MVLKRQLCHISDWYGVGRVWNYMVLKHQKIKEPLFCKEAKLHGAQALQPLKITNVQVWKKIKLHGTQTSSLSIKKRGFGKVWNYTVFKRMLHFPARTHLEAEEIAGHSNQRCRRFCFVIIIPYPDRKANICSIYRWEKMSTISRYWLNVGHKQWYRSDKINLQCLLLIWASEPERIES